MKVLVTGANGQVGTELTARGRTMGLNVLAAGPAELDITDRNAVFKYIHQASPDIVINAAAYTAVDRAEEGVELAFAVNRDGPAYLGEACATVDIPLLHISTDYIFDGEKEVAYLEDDVPNPKGVYGKSKLEGERAVADKLKKHIILRVAWVFAASGNNFVRTMLRLGAERDELSVVSDQQGAPTWAGDIADALLNMTKRYNEQGEIPWGTYHYTGKQATTWHGFAQVIFDEAAALNMLDKIPTVHAITTAQYPTPAQRPKNSVLNCRKIDRAFGITQPDWQVGLVDVLNQWKAQ